jgi:hypothetical protein
MLRGSCPLLGVRSWVPHPQFLEGAGLDPTKPTCFPAAPMFRLSPMFPLGPMFPFRV